MLTGHKRFRIAGVVNDAPKQKVNKDTGEVLGMTMEIAYMGGRQYVTLADPAQAVFVKPGSYVEGEAPVREFGEKCYPGPFTIESINERALPKLTGANPPAVAGKVG